MRQPIADVNPSEIPESTVMTVWPAISVYPWGERLGLWFSWRWPDFYIFRLGNLLALLTIPISLGLYCWRVAPKKAVRYTLTNRRVTIRRGLAAKVEADVVLEAFDEIRIEVTPGQKWFDAGDLVFCHAEEEKFRLPSVLHPIVFRQACMKTRDARVKVQGVVAQQREAVGNGATA